MRAGGDAHLLHGQAKYFTLLHAGPLGRQRRVDAGRARGDAQVKSRTALQRRTADRGQQYVDAEDVGIYRGKRGRG